MRARHHVSGAEGELHCGAAIVTAVRREPQDVCGAATWGGTRRQPARQDTRPTADDAGIDTAEKKRKSVLRSRVSLDK